MAAAPADKMAAAQQRWSLMIGSCPAGPRRCAEPGLVPPRLPAGHGPSAVNPSQAVSDPASMPGRLRRGGRGVLEEKPWRSLEERGSVGARPEHPVLARSKTCDPSFCKATEQAAAAAGTQGHPSPPPSKHAAGYRKAFGELAEREALLACFSCAWQREVPYHGRLYISSRHLCFHSSLLLKDIKAVVPVASISALKKTNTALLVPNALSIRTAEGEKFLFVSLRRREATYQLLKSVCKHLQDNSWSPLASPSTKEILRKPLTSRQSDLEQSAPEPDSRQELPDGPSPTPRQEEEEDEAAVLALSGGGPHTVPWAWTTARPSPLSAVILIYLLLMVALLLTSGYIGLRIVELEQQLAAVGAWPDLKLSHQYKKT
ncbi:GRAM domain-containing protein 2A-like [Nyctibius grandis]|uniref:GRAM domain-containing protein 2A-like n=1 Tax=Nyctibius grandis TaxID=48427 RepID=UPI0035BBB2EF